MFDSINFTSANLIQFVILALVLITVVIALIKRGINKRIGQTINKTSTRKENQKFHYRNKYPEADVFKFRGNILLFSLAMVLGLLVSVFNWTTYEAPVEIEDYAYVLEEDIEIEPPRSTAEPPPPPPPPPPVIQEVPNEILMEEDEIEFEDQSIDASTEIDVPKPILSNTEDTPPPPPPPPPPVEDVEEIFKVVEEMPRFPGCEDMAGTVKEKKACADKKLYEYLYKHLTYPALARENGIDGTVVIRFVVEKNGKIAGASIARDIGGGCGEEALRVVNLMNKDHKWAPGKQRGRAVRVMFTLPVRFKLENT